MSDEFWSNFRNLVGENSVKGREKRGKRGSYKQNFVKNNRVIFRMDDNEFNILENLCKKTGKSKSEVLREAIYSMDLDIKKIDEAFNDE